MTLSDRYEWTSLMPAWVDKAVSLFLKALTLSCWTLLANRTRKLLKTPWNCQGALDRARLLCAISFSLFSRDIIVAFMGCFGPTAVHPFLWVASRSFELAFVVASPMAFAEQVFDPPKSPVLRYIATLLYAGLAVLALCCALFGLDGLRTGHYSYFASLSPPTDDFLTRSRYVLNLALTLYATGLWALMALVTPFLRPHPAKVHTESLLIIVAVSLQGVCALCSVMGTARAFSAWSAHLKGQVANGENSADMKLLQAMIRVFATFILITLHDAAEGKGTGVYVLEEDSQTRSISLDDRKAKPPLEL